MKRKITFFVYPEFELLDLSGPCSAFNLVNEFYGGHYEFSVVSATGGAVLDRAGLSLASEKFAEVGDNETIVAVGGPTAHAYDLGASTKAFLCESSGQGNRVVSVCTGAFLLAAAGLLDGRRATTHWRYAGLLQSRYPKVLVDIDRIYIKEGNICTAAGLTAGIDLALMLIEDDFGSSVAKNVAKDMVVYHRRLGGQSQFSAILDITPTSGRVRDVLCYAREHLREPLSVERLAEVACISPRQFSRTFFNATGMTPAKAIERLRLDVARPRIEETLEPLEQIARDVGLGSAEKLCRSCLHVFGRTSQELRRAARKPRDG
ncbi:DJ-1/PfpI family protein [Methylomonas sp. UP202]|uniref:GlxA family transcriptional regulator n=1 Tax=Methylomonas sp. UP202 TaxID=3040943 RepID=UPI002478FFB1|nr:DJ-1/PfpI family protein [Methylomonas sp. UP202]WGS84017.1 DJ-1/PfpI family protein [Methylomonas sp. UP202]